MINIENVKMKNKLLGLFIITGIIPLILIGLWSASSARSSLMEKSFNQLESVRGIKKAQVEKYFAERQGDMGVLVETVGTLRSEAFRKLEAIQEIKKSQLSEYIESLKTQLHNTKDDPYVITALSDFNKAFEAAGDKVGSARWNTLARKYDPRMRDVMKDNGWYDLFLIHTDGDIVYTVERESDLGMIIPDSSLRSSSLGKAFKKALTMGREEIAIGDFAPYEPSDGVPAAFMVARMHNSRGRLIGFVALQVPLNKINAIMLRRNGMGKTGESYLVGADGFMRSDSYLDPKNRSVEASFKSNTKTDTEATRSALNGGEEQKVILDYNGNPVLSAWDPVEIGSGIRWAMISEIDVAEAFSPVDDNGNEFFVEYQKMYGYYDLFLVNPDGFVFYSAAKEADYQTNLVNGRFASSNLGKLVRNVLNSKQFGFADFKPYAPSNGEPAAFIAQPIVHDDQVEVVVALQLPLGAINSIMQQRDGLGETGETYLVGPDKLMRSDSFLDPTGHSVKASFAGSVENNGVDTEAVNEAFSGKTETKVVIDYNGNPVLSSYVPIKIWNTKWALLAEIDQAEVMGPIYWLMASIVIAVVLIAALGFFIAVSLTRTILRQLGGEPFEIMEIAQNVSIGDLSLKIDSNKQSTGVFEAIEDMVSNLRKTVKLAETIADGDLTVTVSKRSDKDTLGHALETMVNKLSIVVDDIRTASGNVSTGAEQLAATSQSMSQGATEQAGSLEEITSSMNEISSQSKQNAENGEQANQLAGETRDAAEQGSVQMNEMVSAMGEINQSSQEIAKIIKVIDEIAFQTNLLALNAAVEAARAGKYGKGFAVVAEEVRNLAARSATAAKEIAEMIETSVKQVDEGSRIVDKTAEALQNIVGSVTKITDLVGEVASASREQSIGVDQTTIGLDQIDQVTQQNSAHAEESAAAAEELSGQATLLMDMINTFKTSNEGIPTQSITQQASQNEHLLSASADLPQITGQDTTKQKTLPAQWDEEKNNATLLSLTESENRKASQINLDATEFGKY